MAYQINFENDCRGAVPEFTGPVTGAGTLESADCVCRADPQSRLCYQFVHLTGSAPLDISDEVLATRGERARCS